MVKMQHLNSEKYCIGRQGAHSGMGEVKQKKEYLSAFRIRDILVSGIDRPSPDPRIRFRTID
jgi:hypothetical protein